MKNKIFVVSLFVCIMILTFSVNSCQSKEKKTENLLNEGVQLFQQAKYSEAILKYEEALKQNPKSAVGYNLLGIAYRFRFN